MAQNILDAPSPEQAKEIASRIQSHLSESMIKYTPQS